MSKEVQDPKHNMHVLAQIKVTNMNLSVTTDYKVSSLAVTEVSRIKEE